MKITHRRLAGFVIPLFSLRSSRDWGVGELPDLERLIPLMHQGGFDALMLLPLLEPSPGQESPYSPISAFAIDPLYIAIEDVPEMVALGGRERLDAADRDALRLARGSFSVRHQVVRPLKMRWLKRCFKHFTETHDASDARMEAFTTFQTTHADWLDDYALFRTLKAHHPESWRTWPEDLQSKAPEAVTSASQAHAEEIEFRKYCQWIAFGQFTKIRQVLNDAGIVLGGDEPFLTAEDSADVWGRQELYRFDATVGAPPDAFSADGQDWGLPPYRWDRIAESGYDLFLRRGRHAARLYDFVRIDHVVGLYRTYHRPVGGGEPYFVPWEEGAQRAQGEAVLRAFAASGTALIGEDLGVIPDFVRASLWEMEVPGFRVLRWEERDGHVIQPRDWPDRSVATTGTHDTETSAIWWENLNDHDRGRIRSIPQLGAIPWELATSWNRDVHQALLRTVYESPSNLVILPIQDLFGLRTRINIPNTVGPQNWSWRLPWSLEAMQLEEPVLMAFDELGALARETGRTTRLA